MLTPHERKLLLAILAVFLAGGLVRWCRKSQEQPPDSLPVKEAAIPDSHAQN